MHADCYVNKQDLYMISRTYFSKLLTILDFEQIVSSMHVDFGLGVANHGSSYIVNDMQSLGPDAFGFNPPTQLVIGYHWLRFLNSSLIH